MISYNYLRKNAEMISCNSQVKSLNESVFTQLNGFNSFKWCTIVGDRTQCCFWRVSEFKKKTQINQSKRLNRLLRGFALIFCTEWKKNVSMNFFAVARIRGFDIDTAKWNWETNFMIEWFSIFLSAMRSNIPSGQIE